MAKIKTLGMNEVLKLKSGYGTLLKSILLNLCVCSVLVSTGI